jgi:hypothetical protein
LHDTRRVQPLIAHQKKSLELSPRDQHAELRDSATAKDKLPGRMKIPGGTHSGRFRG